MIQKWFNSNDCSHKKSFYRVIRWKLLFDGEGITFLMAGEENLLRGVFLVGQMSKFLAPEWDSSQSPGFPINLCRDNEV